MVNLTRLIWWPFGAASAEKQLSGEERPACQSDVNLVLLQTLVTDQHGGAVAGLKQSDFEVLVDHVPQAISLFRGEDEAVAMGIVVDHSSSMANKWDEVVAAALELARASNPQDQMFVVNFDDSAEFGLPANTAFTSSDVSEDGALSRVVVSGRTALYDALSLAFDHLQEAALGNRVLLLVSDGGDNYSTASLEVVLAVAVKSGAIVYTIGLFDDRDEDRNPRVLRKLADATGGKAYFLADVGEIHKVCQEIARDVRIRYTLGFVPAGRAGDSGFHSIKVNAHTQAQGILSARTREGYFGAPSTKP